MESPRDIRQVGAFGGRTVAEPIEGVGNLREASGIRHPYLWVTLWILFLVLIASGAWYGLRHPKEQTEEEVVANSSAMSTSGALSTNERTALATKSSAVASSTSSVQQAERVRIFERSSAAPAVAGKPQLTASQREALLRSSSAR